MNHGSSVMECEVEQGAGWPPHTLVCVQKSCVCVRVLYFLIQWRNVAKVSNLSIKWVLFGKSQQ